MNYVCISGRLTNDPYIAFTKDGSKKIARFRLAVRRNGKQNEADFLDVMTFDRSADIVEKFMKKGTAVIVEGHIQTGSYEKDGRKVYTTTVCASHIEFMESKKSAEEKPEPAPEDLSGDGFLDAEDGLPFN